MREEKKNKHRKQNWAAAREMRQIRERHMWMPLDFARDIVHGKRVKREDKKRKGRGAAGEIKTGRRGGRDMWWEGGGGGD